MKPLIPHYPTRKACAPAHALFTMPIAAAFKAFVRGGLRYQLLLLLPLAAAGAGEVASSWTSHASDTYYAAAREAGIELTQTLEHVRIAWGTRMHTGFGKGGSGTALQMLEEGFDPAYGETGSPVLSDGVLLVSWSQPSGEVTADLATISERYFDDPAENAILQDNYFRIDADWHTVALDAATGAILWTRIQPSASMNFISTKREHNGISGAARDGLYVTITVLGHVFAYEIATGDLRWSTTIASWNELAEPHKQSMLQQRRLPTQTGGPFGTKRAGAIIVDDVAVVPDLRQGLVGLSTSDGSLLWTAADRLHNQATPTPWVHDGKTYLICNQAAWHSGNYIHLIDPINGATLWSHSTGYNPGQLLVGDDHLLLNDNNDRSADALLKCYHISTNGLAFRWQLADTDRNRVHIKKDFGAQRKGVIRDGVVYLLVGLGRSEKGYLVSFDLATGTVIHEPDEPRLGENQGMPFIAEDKFYVQMNSAHSGGRAGLMVYQLEDGGRFTYLGDVPYEGLGIKQLTDYLHPIETPYGSGKLYMRGHRQIVAIDLSVVTEPMADLTFHGAWAGFARPVRGVVFAEGDHSLRNGHLESPPRLELGVIGTTAHRSDSWTQLHFPQGLTIGEAFATEAEFTFVVFSWPGTIRMNKAVGRQWTGTWSRHLPGWEETVAVSGTLHESSEGGYDQKGWPTGWLAHQPVTFFGPLPEGQQRIFLQLLEILPRHDGLKNLTLSLDHNGERVVSGVGGAFSFNQAYHEVDASGLSVTADGISGTALIILNPDVWVPGDMHNGGSLAGYLSLDLTFGEPNAEGIYPVSGDWQAEWGIEITRTGPIHATLRHLPFPVERLKLDLEQGSNQFAFSFQTDPGARYQIETSANLAPDSWQPSGPPFSGTGEHMTVHRSAHGNGNFFRIVTLP
jgi:outer membrane protein assembly factor BamB